jgi:hypothetical protein
VQERQLRGWAMQHFRPLTEMLVEPAASLPASRSTRGPEGGKLFGASFALPTALRAATW